MSKRAPIAAVQLPEGTSLTLGIRTENIVASTVPESGFPVIVDLVEELGGSRVAYCNLGNRELSVVLPAGEDQIEGKTIWLSWNTETMDAFDPVTDCRMDTTFSHLCLQ